MAGDRTARHKVERSAGMVQQVMPGWSWQEGFDAPQRARLAHRIVGEPDARLPAVRGFRLYAATVYPVLSRQPEEALDEAAGSAEDLWKVARPKRADAYTTLDHDPFIRILPVLFEFGPPEIWILALLQAPGATLDGLGRVITGIMERCDANSGGVRMDFDASDLFRIT